MKTILLFVSILLAENTQAQPVSEYWAWKVSAEIEVLKDIIKNETRYGFDYYLYRVSDQKSTLAKTFSLYQQSAGLSQNDLDQINVDSTRQLETSWGKNAEIRLNNFDLAVFMASANDHAQVQQELLGILSGFEFNWSKMREASSYQNTKQ